MKWSNCVVIKPSNITSIKTDFWNYANSFRLFTVRKSLCKSFKYSHTETKLIAWRLKLDKHLHAMETEYIPVRDTEHKICIQTCFILLKQWTRGSFFALAAQKSSNISIVTHSLAQSLTHSFLHTFCLWKSCLRKIQTWHCLVSINV